MDSPEARRRAYLDLWGAVRATVAADRVREIVALVIADIYDRGLDEKADPYFGRHDVPHDTAEEECGEIDWKCRDAWGRTEAGLRRLGELDDPVDRFMAVFVRGLRELIDERNAFLFSSLFRPRHDGGFDPEKARLQLGVAMGPGRTALKLQLMYHHMPDVLAGGRRQLTMLKTSGDLDIELPRTYDAPLR